MKKKFLYVLLVFFLFIKAENTSASHGVGADLTYVCTGGNNYRFFFTFYRDCAGIAASNSYYLAGTSTCGGSVSIALNLDSTIEIGNTCSLISTMCTNAASPYMGVEANYYHGDITLPSICNFWTFGLSPAICNRNAAITNLTPSGITYCLYVQATLDNSIIECNNSPTFSTMPVAFLCANTIQYSSQHAYDLDNDSISYEMYTPHSDAQSDVQYILGLSGTQPVTYTSDSTRFDPSTGEIRFLANGPQVTVVAVRASDYRNGILIGSVERDIQVIFENCTDNPPVASGINGTPFFSTHICYDSVLTFQFTTNDLDQDSTFISWDNGIPSGIFMASGGLFQTGYFGWQPDSSFISNNPYSFTVTVTDNACPMNGSNTYTFQIYVDSCQATTDINEVGNFIQEFSAAYSGDSRTIHFQYQLEKPAPANISLYDLSGREVENIRIEKSLLVESNLNVAGLSSGLYLLKLNTDNGISQTLKVSIQ